LTPDVNFHYVLSGAGNDMIIYDRASVPNYTGSIVDGQAGTNDTLLVTYTDGTNPTIDLTGVTLTNIERIQLQAATAAQVDTVTVGLTEDQMLFVLTTFEGPLVGTPALDTVIFQTTLSNLDSYNLSSKVGVGNVVFQVTGDSSNEFISGAANSRNIIYGGGGNDGIFGGGFDDALYGGSGGDGLYGGQGRDFLEGGPGGDFLSADAGNDTANDTRSYANSSAGVSVNLTTGLGSGGDAENDVYSGTFDIIIGSTSNDTIVGKRNYDGFEQVLYGGAGDDLLHGNRDSFGSSGNGKLFGGDGNDTFRQTIDSRLDAFYGGGDIDTLDLTGAETSIVNLSNSTILVASESSSITGVENVIGTSFNDTLTGDGNVNSLSGGDKDDIIYGGANNDTLNGGAGDDTVTGGTGADSLDGGAGSGDLLGYGSSSAGVSVNLQTNSVSGGDAQGDTISGFEGVEGGSGNDTLSGNDSANLIYGGNGNDGLYGGAGNDILYGGAGDDFYEGGVGEDEIYDSAGVGIDTLSYANSSAGVSVDLTTNFVEGGDATNDQVLGQFEIVIGSAHNDTLTGVQSASSPPVLYGGGGDDIIYGSQTTGNLAGSSFGGDGNDLFKPNDFSNVDNLFGGNNVDTLDLDPLNSGASVDLGANTITVAGSTTTITGVENVIGTTFNDTIVGDGQANALFGGVDGDDTITGGAGNDTIGGGTGDDTVAGGTGADILYGGAENDTLSYQTSSAGVTVNLATNSVSGGDAQGDIISGFEGVIGTAQNDTLTATNSGEADLNSPSLSGLAGDDILYGGSGNDLVYGGIGNDTLIGKAGDDAFYGGTGNDFYEGGAGRDRFEEAVYGGVDTISYASATSGVSFGRSFNGVGGDANGDFFVGDFEVLIGSSHNDVLYAKQPQSGPLQGFVIYGGGGDDKLIGQGSVSDTVTGASYGDVGNDVFLIGFTGEIDDIYGGIGHDTADFSMSIVSFSDLIVDLSANTITATNPSTTASIQGVEDIIGSSGFDRLIGDGQANSIDGNQGSDTIFGGLGNDTLRGGGENDTIEGGAGADSLDGGSGDGDVLSYASSTVGVTVNLVTDSASGGDAQGDTVANFEVLVGGSGNDTLTAGNDNFVNFVFGNNGDDVIYTSNDLSAFTFIYGGIGNDQTFGDVGAQLVFGGAGDDTLSGSGQTDSLNGDSGNDVIYGGAGFDEIYGGDNDDIVYGGANQDFIFGGIAFSSADNGNDLLYGGLGGDVLVGDNGNDTLDGGPEGDELAGGNGIDAVSYASYTGSAVMFIDLSSGFGFGGDARDDQFSSIENVIGSRIADNIYGGNDANTIWAGGGDDAVGGQRGDDVIYGGIGNDFLAGLEDNDTILPGLGNDTVDGGSGSSDTVSYADLFDTTPSRNTFGVRVSLADQGSVQVTRGNPNRDPSIGAGNDLLIGFEN
ncbi:MAG: calcium-binding protein, partial [Pseudomonadota bacterium]